MILLVSALACATGAAAQGPRADQARTVFTPDRLVRVWVDARRMEGRVATLADSLLVLRHGASLERIAVADVDTAWVAKRAIAKGAAIGAGIGGVGLGALAVVMVRGLCDSVNGCGEDYLPAFFGWGALGAAGGAALGAGLGALADTWERAWP
jgi:hypothetical protein